MGTDARGPTHPQVAPILFSTWQESPSHLNVTQVAVTQYLPVTCLAKISPIL